MTDVATDYTTKELMAAFVASEIEDGEAVSVGASLPVCRAGILLAHLTHAPNLKVLITSRESCHRPRTCGGRDKVAACAGRSR